MANRTARDAGRDCCHRPGPKAKLPCIISSSEKDRLGVTPDCYSMKVLAL